MELYTNESNWEDSAPAELHTAIKHLRDLFIEGHRKCGKTTKVFCYSLLHEGDGLQEITKDYLQPLQYLKGMVGKAADQRFDALIKEQTPSSTFKAFFDLYMDVMILQAVEIFKQMVEMGAAKESLLNMPYLEWAQSQTQNMIRDKRPNVRRWVRDVCDKQPPSGPDDDPDEIFSWRKWQAPKFLTMKPARDFTFQADQAWERMDAELSGRLLTEFEYEYVIHLEGAVKKAAGAVALAVAKQPLVVPDCKGAMDDLERPLRAQFIEEELEVQLHGVDKSYWAQLESLQAPPASIRGIPTAPSPPKLQGLLRAVVTGYAMSLFYREAGGYVRKPQLVHWLINLAERTTERVLSNLVNVELSTSGRKSLVHHGLTAAELHEDITQSLRSYVRSCLAQEQPFDVTQSVAARASVPESSKKWSILRWYFEAHRSGRPRVLRLQIGRKRADRKRASNRRETIPEALVREALAWEHREAPEDVFPDQMNPELSALLIDYPDLIFVPSERAEPESAVEVSSRPAGGMSDGQQVLSQLQTMFDSFLAGQGTQETQTDLGPRPTEDLAEPSEQQHALRRKNRSKPLIAHERKKLAIIFGAIQNKSTGMAYCRELVSQKLLTPARWRGGGCPRNYAKAYPTPKWKHRIQDEKTRYREKYDDTSLAEREMIIAGDCH